MFAKSVRWVAGLVLTAVVVVMVGVLLVPRAFGLEPYVITSGSMRPTFDPGAVVLTKDVPTEELEVGDVVTFQTPDDVTTHRIVERRTVGVGDDAVVTFETRGDANNAPDDERLDSRNVLGEVRFAMAGVGYAVNFLRTPLGLGLLAVLFLVAVLTGDRRSAPTSSEETTHPMDREPTGASR